MNGIGIIMLIAGFFATLGIFFSGKRSKKTEEYILSRNSLKTGALSLTLFATGMGVWVLFGPAEALLTAGLVALLFYALSSTLSLWMFGIVGAKIRDIFPHGTSLSEFVLKRFGTLMYFLVLGVSFVYMVLVMTAELTGIGLAGSIIFGTLPWHTIAIIGVATLSYTALGGFRASVATDKIQSLVIMPLFALIVGISVINLGNPFALLEVTHIPSFGLSGWEYGVALLIGVLSAEAFNQVWWQRVYSGENVEVMQRGFFIAGMLVFPVVFVAGILGLYGLGTDAGVNPAVAVFHFLSTTPPWLALSGMILAITLMMSSMDSLLNGMVSIFTVDIQRIHPHIGERTLLRIAQGLTLLFALGGMTVATYSTSVLYLFLVADLVCAGAAFTVFYGMFSKKINGTTAFVASVAGIISGALFFPDPSFTRGSLLWSFVVAFLLPMLITLVFSNSKKLDSLC